MVVVAVEVAVEEVETSKIDQELKETIRNLIITNQKQKEKLRKMERPKRMKVRRRNKERDKIKMRIHTITSTTMALDLNQRKLRSLLRLRFLP